MAGTTYVAPTRRLAHFLRARHDAACQARGLGVWPTPDVVTWPELLRRQFDVDRAAGRTTARWLDTSHGLIAWEQIVRRDVDLRPVLLPSGLGAVAQHSWELLHAYRIPVRALAGDEGPEVQAFARWAAEFGRWLEQGGWLDPALASLSVGPLPADTPVEFVGFDRWTPAQAAFIERVAGQGARVAVRPAVPADAPLDARAVECNDFDAELDTAARWAAQRLQEQPDERLALIVPQLARERARVRRVLDRVLVPAAAFTGGPVPESMAYELAAARPLLERPVVSAALDWIAACIATPELSAAGALLRGAHDGAAASESYARAELDVMLRKSGVPQAGLDYLAREARAHGCPATAAQLQAAAARARTWTGSRLPSQWAPEFFELLRAVGWPGPDPASAEHQAVQRLQSLLGEFGASDDVAGPLRVSVAFAHLRELAAGTAFEPQEIAAPLLVIDPETALGMHFDAIWVCGLDAARWPPPANPDPFLPRELQARQGVPGATAALSEQQARRTLQRLVVAAATAICSVSRFEDEAPLLPSALVTGLPRLDSIPLWPGAQASSAQFDARPALDTLLDGSLPAFARQEVVKGGSRLFELQGACPFRAAVELRLGGVELENPAAGIAATERGRLAHAVLQAFWNEVREQAVLLAMSAGQRVATLRTHVQAVLAPLRATADEVGMRLLDLEERWLAARVLELLQQDAERAPFTVELVEDARVIDVGGVQTKIVLDRVDRLADGTLAVIDYKTGAGAKPAAWMGERPELPQLPLYVRAVGQHDVGAVAFGIVCKGSTGYRGFAREGAVFPQLKAFDAARAPFKDYASWDDLLQAWNTRLESLAREHAQGDARLAPNPARACRYCHLPGVCRSAQALQEAEEGDDAAV
ncbi:MAG: PD-(D/E)XK nuclease family protein [Gammaproteobacteria bacterium]|nr:PD-(D/E)XK nuclease family protein [Gammaproteobacteria bacterium]